METDLVRRVAVAVFELVAEHGVGGASMRRVASATGLSTGTLNYHFGNKQGLILAAVDFAYRPPADWKEHQDTTGRALRRLLKRYVLDEDKVRVWWRFFCAITAHASSDADLAARQAHNQRYLVDFFARVIRQGRQSGDVDQCVDPRMAAESLVGLAHGLALRQLLEPSPAVLRRCRRLLHKAVRDLTGDDAQGTRAV